MPEKLVTEGEYKWAEKELNWRLTQKELADEYLILILDILTRLWEENRESKKEIERLKKINLKAIDAVEAYALRLGVLKTGGSK